MEEKKQSDIRMAKLIEHALELASADEVLQKNVVGIGDGAHINIPRKHLGKKAKVIIFKKGESEPS